MKIKILAKTSVRLMLFLLLMSAAAFGQTTEFTYQGKLAETGGVAAAYDFEFRLCAAETSCAAPLAVASRPATPVSGDGVFTVKLNFGGTFFDGSDRFLEIAVKRPADAMLTLLLPRQKLTAAPYAIQAVTAADAGRLGGLPASQYVLTTDSRLNPANYVQNTTAAQPGVNFNIGGTGSAATLNAATAYNLGGSRILSGAGTNNLFVGAGTGAVNTGQSNSFVGTNAGLKNTTGDFSSFFGSGAGRDNTGGSNNSFFGSDAGLKNTTGFQNSFFGREAGAANTTGNFNSFFGRSSGFQNTTGVANSFFGMDSGITNTTGGGNSFFGEQAGNQNSTGNNNTFVGLRAGYNNTIGAENSYFGTDAGGSTTQGVANTLIGTGSGFLTSTGIRNTFVGRGAGDTNTTGSNNTALGMDADFTAADLTFATALGAGASVGTSNTVVIGRPADTVQIPGAFNLAGPLSASSINVQTQFNIGNSRVLSIGGTDNIFAGVGAGAANTSGVSNSFFGTGAGLRNTSGSDNVFVGRRTGENNLTGNLNAFFSNNAGSRNTSGSQNVFFGDSAGQYNTTGGQNIFIGYDAGNPSTAAQVSNSVAIGAGARVTASNTIALGSVAQTTRIDGNLAVYGGDTSGTHFITAETVNSPQFGRGLGVTRLFVSEMNPVYLDAMLCHQAGISGIPYQIVGYCVTSNVARSFKTEIKPFTGGLAIIKNLNPVAFKWKANGRPALGLNAEDVAAAAPQLVSRDEKGEARNVSADNLNTVLISAVKEQQTQIEAQQKQIEALKKLVCSLSPGADVCREEPKLK